jgi:hypothetical protein
MFLGKSLPRNIGCLETICWKKLRRRRRLEVREFFG